MSERLLAVVLRIWAALHAPNNPEIANAIVQAVEDAHVFDGELVAATMAAYSFWESRNRTSPTPESWDSKAGRVCGAWQIQCGMAKTTVGEARAWIWMVQHGGLGSVSPSAERAGRRLALVERLLDDGP